MRNFLVLTTFLFLISCGDSDNNSTASDNDDTRQVSEKYPTLGEIERIDPALDAILPSQA